MLFKVIPPNHTYLKPFILSFVEGKNPMGTPWSHDVEAPWSHDVETPWSHDVETASTFFRLTTMYLQGMF